MLRFTIIGCGQMGSWFAENLARRGADILLLDRNSRRASLLAKRTGGEVLNSLRKIPRDRPLLLALPISEIGGVLEQLTNHGRPGLRIVEISSFKKPVIESVRYARRKGHIVASIHPLFGPGQKNDENTVTVHVERASRAEDTLIRMLLPKSEIRRMSWMEHDRAMLVALSLTHFIGVSAAHLLSMHGAIPVKTRSLNSLLSLISIAISEPNDFYTDYPMTHIQAIRLFKKYSESASRWLKMFKNARAASRIMKIRKTLQARYNLDAAYKRVYSNSSNC
ncbi:MAG: prephenate dehydrogenase/arogenate dehydrogenase family protein [Nitrososphaerota archaeon]